MEYLRTMKPGSARQNGTAVLNDAGGAVVGRAQGLRLILTGEDGAEIGPIEAVACGGGVHDGGHLSVILRYL